MPRPALAVAIPTYRRPEQLRRCVESILRSAGKIEVPIHVADDSTDDTNAAVMREQCRLHPTIVHHRNPRNLGIDRNILHAVDLCDARHVWIMGEDDLMEPAAISTVLSVLAGGERPFVFANYTTVDEGVAIVLRERSLELASDAEIPAEDFLAASAWAMGFIGACIVDRDLWETVDRERYVGTYYAHTGTILEYLHGRRVYLVARPLVLNRAGRPGAFTWTRSTFEVLHGWGRMTDLLRTVYPAEACSAAEASYARAHGLGSATFFSYLRADRALDPNAWERHIRAGPYTPRQRALAWAIAHLPPTPFRAARAALATARRLRNRRVDAR
jgi:glycosyltransferase involved in cell wall biosynthesis